MTIAANEISKEGQNVARSKFFQYFAAVSATFGIISTGMHFGWPSPSSPQLRSGKYYFSISSEVDSWLAVTPPIGSVIGALGAGLVVDIFGRKNLIVMTSVPFMISWILIAVARSSVLMFVARFLAGLCDGVSFTVVPMYLGEIAEPQIRGLVGSMCPVSIIFGILMINIIGSFLPIDTTAYISVIFPAFLLITFVKMPESPYYLLMKGKTKEATRSLKIFRETSDIYKELDRISIAIEEQNSKDKGMFFNLFRDKTNRRGFLIQLGLRGFQQLTGTTAIIFYCQTIFVESKDFLSPSIATIIYFSTQIILCLLSSAIVDIAGRRPLLILSNIGTAICLFLNGCYLYLKNGTDINTSRFDFLPIVGLIGYIIAFSLGWQTIPLVMLGELFPTNTKAFASSFLDIYNSVMITIVSKFFYWSKEEFGLHVSFLSFGGFCVLALVFIIIFVPETKNKTLEDIQEELKAGDFIWCKKSKYTVKS